MLPVICFGQQPNGFFPKRFFHAKIQTAFILQEELGGRIVYFCHDSDHDYRETITPLVNRQTGEVVRLNFEQENKLQKKYSPLYLKRIPQGWQGVTARKLPQYVDKPLVDLFASVAAANVADFCLSMYQKLGLLEGIEVVRSSDPDFRAKASELMVDYFADVPFEGEIVRSQWKDGQLVLHRGGGEYVTLPEQIVTKKQKNPDAHHRFEWMRSVVGCSHYIYGAGEAEYLAMEEIAGVTFVRRDEIELSGSSWLDFK